MSHERVYELLDESEGFPPGATQLALLEEAVRIADTLDDVRLAYDARIALINSASFSGYPEKLLVAFAWCLAQADKTPDAFELPELLWRYKWALQHVTGFPQISGQQIAEMQQDMQRRVTQLGYSLRPVHYMRWRNLLHMGETQEALRHVAAWQAEPRDELADCPACECHEHVKLMVRLGRDSDALEIAQPILQGRMRCSSIPCSTFATILRPLLRLGRDDEAKHFHREGYRLARGGREYLFELSEHLLYRVLTNDIDRGVQLFEKHLPWAVDIAELESRFWFYVAAGLLLEAVASSRTEPMKLRLPTTLPVYEPGDTYDPARLAAWFNDAAQEIAARFNARNGNDYFTEQYAATRREAHNRRSSSPSPSGPG